MCQKKINPRISVIVPVYNAEKFIPRCISSVLSQSYQDLELLLVDDGSTDGSLQICNMMAGTDERIKVLHKENGGVTSARRMGVECSRGEFICFVDADDMLAADALEIMMGQMREDVDIVVGGESDNKTITGNQYVDLLLQKVTTLALWGKLYRKNIVISSGAMDICPEINIGEDHLANVKMALISDKVVCISAIVYSYIDNASSVWRTRSWSLEYEEMLRMEMKAVLSDKIGQFSESWYKFQLYIIYDLIVHRVKFSYNREWIKNLFDDRNRYHLSLREKIVKTVRWPFLCRLLLVSGLRIKAVIKCI